MLQINTKAEFDQIIEKIDSLVKQYENNVLHYNQYQFYLANGDRISFEMLPQYIGHLLGIRLDYLRSTNLFKNQDSYSLLKEFLDNAYSVYQNVQAGHLSYKSIFSDYLEEKLETFENILYYLSPDDIEFVCKYDKSRTFQLGLETDYPCDYFFAKKSKNNDIYLLGLIRQTNAYAPMTSMIFHNDELQSSKLKKLFTNQILTFVNSMSITNPITNFRNTSHMNLPLKLEKVNKLNNYSRYGTGISIDISSEYQFAINGNIIKENKMKSYKIMCQQLAKAIGNHEIFSLEQVDDTIVEQLDEEMIQLIQTHNNELCKGESNTSAQTTYTDLLEQYKALASQVNILKQQLDQSQLQISTYFEQIQELQKENESYKTFQQQIFDVVESQKIK